MNKIDIQSGNDLQAILSELWRESEAPTQVRNERADAIARYKRSPYPEDNPDASDSKIISSDVYDSVEWQLADLLNVIYSPEGVVEFKAESPEDEEAALAETKAVNDAILNSEDGFLCLYETIKNTLLIKNGIMQVTWDDKGEHEVETYKGITFNEFMKLQSDKDFTITQQTLTISGQQVDEQALQLVLQQQPQLVEAFVADVKGLQKVNGERLRLKAIPPDNFRVYKGNTKQNLRHVEFCGHKVITTVTQMLADGFDKQVVEDAKSYGNSNSLESTARLADKTELLTKSTEQIEYFEVYFRRDLDGDGFPELHQILSMDETFSKIISIEQVDGHGYVSFAVNLNPHDFYGISKADEVIDLQKGKTALLRQGLNNLYLANEPKILADNNNDIDEDALLAGGQQVVRSNDVNGLVPFAVPFVAEKVFPVLEVFDRMKEMRTGWSREAAGLDPKALADSTNFVASTIVNGAQIRMKLMARLIGETGLKELFKLVREILRKKAPQDMRVEFGGKVSTVNPRDWTLRRELKLVQGLGYMSKLEKITMLESIYAKQKEIVAAGAVQIVALDNIYNTLREMSRVVGISNPNLYFKDPATYQAPPPKEQPIDAAVDIEKAKAVSDATHKAAVLDLEREKLRHQAQVDAENIALKRREIDIKQQSANKGATNA